NDSQRPPKIHSPLSRCKHIQIYSVGHNVNALGCNARRGKRRSSECAACNPAIRARRLTRKLFKLRRSESEFVLGQKGFARDWSKLRLLFQNPPANTRVCLQQEEEAPSRTRLASFEAISRVGRVAKKS